MASDFVIAETPIASRRADAARDDLGWTASVLVTMTALLALINAASFKSWAETLPPTPTNVAVLDVAERWYAVTERLGLAAPRAAIRGAWTDAKALRFPLPSAPPTPQR